MTKRVWITLAKWVVAVGVLTLLYRQLPSRAVVEGLSNVKPAPLIIFMAIVFANAFISVAKWSLLLRADGVNERFRRLLETYMIGGFISLFLPSNIGGDVYRVVSMGPGQRVKSAASVFVERLTGFIALTFIGSIACLLGFRELPSVWLAALPLGFLGLMLALATLVMWPVVAGRIMHALRLNRLALVNRLVGLLQQSFDTYATRPGLLLKVLGLSLVYQLLVVVAIRLLSLSLDLSLGWGIYFLFVPLIGILEAIPISVYGLGLRDAGYVLLYASADVPGHLAHALSTSVLYVCLTAGYAMLGGLLLLRRLLSGESATTGEEGPLYRQSVLPGMRGRGLRIGVMLRHMADPGGAEVYTCNLLRAMLAEDRVNHYVLFWTDYRFIGSFAGLTNVTEWVAPIEGHGGLRRWMWDQVTLPRLLQAQGMDLIFNPVHSAPFRFKGRVVLTVHGLTHPGAGRRSNGWTRLWHGVALRLYCTKADAVLVKTQYGKRELVRRLAIPAGKIYAIPESFREDIRRVDDPVQLAGARAVFKLPQHFLLVAGITGREAGLSLLLNAMVLLKRRGLSHKLIFAEADALPSAVLDARVADLGLTYDVMRLGRCDPADWPALLSLAEGLVLDSSCLHGAARLLEAQACGCPVVLSNRGELSEMAGDRGALTFNPEDAAGLAAQLHRVLTDPVLRSDMVQRAHANAKRYSWRDTARNTIQVLESLL